MKEHIKKLIKKYNHLPSKHRISLLCGALIILWLCSSISLILPVRNKIIAADQTIAQTKTNIKLLTQQKKLMQQEYQALAKKMAQKRDLRRILRELFDFNPGLRIIKMTDDGQQGPVMNGISFLGSNFITLVFEGDYFSILNYLTTLEKIPVEIYWDALNYHVTKYPLATVELKIHTLDNE